MAGIAGFNHSYIINCILLVPPVVVIVVQSPRQRYEFHVPLCVYTFVKTQCPTCTCIVYVLHVYLYEFIFHNFVIECAMVLLCLN